VSEEGASSYRRAGQFDHAGATAADVIDMRLRGYGCVASAHPQLRRLPNETDNSHAQIGR